MIEYAIFLRALAAVLITNSHYTNVYPVAILASGGLLGDVIFFALSGFVLANVRSSFWKWYKKRFLRIYITIWIITLIYIILGYYTFEGWSVFSYFVYPTYYHFVASIIVLYVPYFVIVNNNYLKDKLLLIMFVTFLIQLLIYIFIYDKTYYHIDTVREPMIRFLFFQSMLLGLYFRINHDNYMDAHKISNWFILILSLLLYFFSKLIFSRIDSFNQFQIVNQYTLFVSLYYLFKCFSSIDKKLSESPKIIKSATEFVSKITLQIYVVQYVIIDRFSSIIFPLNWVVITFTILCSAYMLYLAGNSGSDLILKNKNYRP